MYVSLLLIICVRPPLQCTRLVSDTLQYQKDPYEFTFISEVCGCMILLVFTRHSIEYSSLLNTDNIHFFLCVQISKVLLCTEIPGNDDDLYQVAKAIDDKDAISINMQL